MTCSESGHFVKLKVNLGLLMGFYKNDCKPMEFIDVDFGEQLQLVIGQKTPNMKWFQFFVSLLYCFASF